ncbi:MAG: hypothetical protein AB7V56_12235 [Candidatus Nitrosocosmicus sp.]
MRRCKVILIILLFTFAIGWFTLSGIDNVYAVTMTADINPDSNRTIVNFNDLHASLFSYPSSSKLGELFKQLPPRISIAATSQLAQDASNQSQTNSKEMNTLLKSINNQFEKMNSLVRASEINLTFILDTRQISQTETSIAQRINIDLQLEGYVFQDSNDANHKYIDLNWRDLKIDEPVLLQISSNQTNSLYDVDINHLPSTLYSLNPAFKNELNIANSSSSSSNNDIMNSSLLDFSKLSLSMDKWYVLFDPAASLADTSRYNFKGEENGARAVTIYSLGEGSIREGKHEDSVYDVSLGENGQYKDEITIPAPNARIDILGYSKMSTTNGDDTAIISQTNEGGSSYAGNFPLVVLGGFGAIMGVVMAIVLLRSRKTPDVSQ